VDWFDGARRQAQEQRGRVRVQFDFDKLIAKTTLSDGEVETRQAHPITGNPVLVQRGRGYTKVRYSDDGDLALAIESSSGASVQLQYDDHGRLSRFGDSRGTTMTFEFNDAGKPTRISLGKAGELRIEYDQA